MSRAGTIIGRSRGRLQRLAACAIGVMALPAVHACAKTTPPLVMLIVDTSGSMERKSGCECTTPGCDECLPDCTRKQRSGWIELLETLTGTYTSYGCVTRQRTIGNGASYDLNYYLPHIAALHDSQADDGLLDVYRGRLRFGLATFDAWDTYVGGDPLVPATDFDFDKSAGVDGMWSYNPERTFGEGLRRADGTRIGELRYPNAPVSYYIDTGIRGPQAAQGALQAALDPADEGAVNARIQKSLLSVRPYGGTPTAAAFDDLYYYLRGAHNASAAGERPYVVLITDGYPDDFRSYGCDCATTEDPNSPTYCGGPDNDPTMMHCPYPTVQEAAHTLRCGQGKHCNQGVAERVYALGYGPSFSPDQGASTAIADDLFANGDLFFLGGHSILDTIALEGATAARYVGDPQALRRELSTIFDEIAQTP